MAKSKKGRKCGRVKAHYRNCSSEQRNAMRSSRRGIRLIRSSRAGGSWKGFVRGAKKFVRGAAGVITKVAPYAAAMI
jgi:hypothetical protein